MGYEKAGKLGTRSLLGGTARSILDSGGSFAQLHKAGRRHSSAYRPYLGLGAKQAAAMARVLIAASDDGAEPGGSRGERIPWSNYLSVWDPK